MGSCSLLTNGSNLATSCDVEKFLTLSAANCVVRLSVIVFLEECLLPLTKLQVVLVFSFAELAYVNVAFNTILIESSLKNFVVFNKFVLMFSVPLNFAERKSVWVKAVHYGAINGSSGALLNL